MGAILRRMIPSDLIVSPTVRRSQIDVFIGPIVLHPKSDADEPASPTVCASRWLPGYIHFNRAVSKYNILDDGIRSGVRSPGCGIDLHCLPALEGGLRDRCVFRDESIRALGRKRDSKQYQ